MIIGFGTDICENKRIQDLYSKFGDRFLNRIYTTEEIAYCIRKKNPVPHLSARFALKEAFIKSLDVKVSLGLSYKEVYLWGGLGKKNIQVSGNLKYVLSQMDVDHTWFSISHAKNYSVATVLLEKTGV